MKRRLVELKIILDVSDDDARRLTGQPGHLLSIIPLFDAPTFDAEPPKTGLMVLAEDLAFELGKIAIARWREGLDAMIHVTRAEVSKEVYDTVDSIF